MASEGLRYDEGKERWDLLPYDALFALVQVYTHGATKYAPRNWERGMSYGRVVGSLWRHFYKRFVLGERLDKESGLPHLSHFAWNAVALLTYDLRGIGTDDITLSKVGMDSRPQKPPQENDRSGSGPAIGVRGGSVEGSIDWRSYSASLCKYTLHPHPGPCFSELGPVEC